jgi:exopolysaccharide/PEP-CTERM locus tyrosine autokinase
MSRIERALEQAVKMREGGSTAAPSSPVVETPLPGGSPSERAAVGVCTGLPGAEAFIDPQRVNEHIVAITDPKSPSAEQYRKLRARLIQATKEKCLNTIMVTSPGIGEGKTVTSINLAVTLAGDLDRSVLLVDADLRNPSVHTYLGVDSSRGITDYLLGSAELPEVMMRTNYGDLYILPAGSPPDNPAELLSSERMQSLLQQLKHQCASRYVIIDSSPVLVAADALALSAYVDGVLLVVKAEQTLPKSAVETVSLLKDRTLLGVVFNNVPPYLAASDHHYYYHHYGKYGQTGSRGNGKG